MRAVLTRMLPSSLQDACHLDRAPGPWHEGGASPADTVGSGRGTAGFRLSGMRRLHAPVAAALASDGRGGDRAHIWTITVHRVVPDTHHRKEGAAHEEGCAGERKRVSRGRPVSIGITGLPRSGMA